MSDQDSLERKQATTIMFVLLLVGFVPSLKVNQYQGNHMPVAINLLPLVALLCNSLVVFLPFLWKSGLTWRTISDRFADANWAQNLLIGLVPLACLVIAGYLQHRNLPPIFFEVLARRTHTDFADKGIAIVSTVFLYVGYVILSSQKDDNRAAGMLAVTAALPSIVASWVSINGAISRGSDKFFPGQATNFMWHGMLETVVTCALFFALVLVFKPSRIPLAVTLASVMILRFWSREPLFDLKIGAIVVAFVLMISAKAIISKSQKLAI